MTTTIKLTPKQKTALQTIAAADCEGRQLRESSVITAGTVYWQHVAALEAAGLITVGGPCRTITITDTGRAAAAPAQVDHSDPHRAYLDQFGYRSGDRLKLRRLTSAVTHHAQPDPPRFYRATVFGADCLMAVAAPVTAACGAVLQGGEVVVMENATRVGCTACRRAVTP